MMATYSVSEMIECDLCGARIRKRGVGSHQRGARCLAGSTRRRYVQQGYGVFNLSYRHMADCLKEAGWIEDVREDIVGWAPGWHNRRGRYTYALYVKDGGIMRRVLQVTKYLYRNPRVARDVLGVPPGWRRSLLAIVEIFLKDAQAWMRAQLITELAMSSATGEEKIDA